MKHNQTFTSYINAGFIYASAFLVPVLLSGLLLLFYNRGFGNPIPGAVNLSGLLARGLASVCFFYFCSHSSRLSISRYTVRVLFSAAYGLSSYGLVQESSLSVLAVYILFPVLFLYFEDLQSEQHSMRFIFLCAVLLLLNPQTALPLILLLTLLYILELFIQNRLTLGMIVHYSVCVLFAVALSAVRLFPYLLSIYQNHGTYGGFRFHYSIPVFLSRLLPCHTASAAFFSQDGMDLYFGLFFLLISLLFFFNDKIPRRIRLVYGLFSISILLAIEVSPVNYALNLFQDFSSSTISYDFIFVFWSLYLGMITYPYLNRLRIRNYAAAAVVVLLLTGTALLWSAHNFHPVAVPSIILFGILTILLTPAAFLSKRISNMAFHFLYAAILLEFFCSAFISTNQDFIPSSRSTQSAFVFSCPPAESDSDPEAAVLPASQISEEEYARFSQETSASDVYQLVGSLSDALSLDDGELALYGNRSLLNNFEYSNALCHKLGYEEDLFLPAENIELTFAADDNYIITPIAAGIYNIQFRDPSVYPGSCYIPFTVSAPEDMNQDIYFYNDYSENLLCLHPEMIHTGQTCYLSVYPQESFTVNLQLQLYTLNPTVQNTLSETIRHYLAELNAATPLISAADYLGICFTCIGIFLFLLFSLNRDKDKLCRRLLAIRNILSDWKLPGRIKRHLWENRMYYLSFFLPCLLFVVSMILYDCTPFGENSFFDEDGLCLTLPSKIDTYYNLQEGNTYFDPYGGYGNSLYAWNPLAAVHAILSLLSPSMIAPFLLFMEAVCLGLCGLNTVFYLTHRLNGTCADKRDSFLLIPALIYSLNTYMLAMHGFTDWYYTLMAFPLLILCMDYIMYRKKTFLYVLILAFCMITNIYLGLYICIFLVIYFFTYPFDSVKDLFRKGIRFALFSLLAALNSFFIISNTLLSTYDSPYHEKDSIFPSPGLHTNFLDQWKNHMIFSPSGAVTADNGYVSLYCGVLSLLLVMLFFLAGKLHRKDKLRKLLPLLLLYISFNGNVLSYIWNGLHYQSKVPNRYAFLLMFLTATLAYDGLRHLTSITCRQLLLAAVSAIAAFAVFQFGGEGNSLLAFASTVFLIVFYCSLLAYGRYTRRRFPLKKVLVTVFSLEITCNMIFTTGNYNLNSIQLFGDYEDGAEYIQEELNAKEEFFRIGFPSSHLTNCGQIYHVPSNSLFNSFVSSHQVNTNYLYGFVYGTNIISSNYNSTPVGCALNGTRYIYLPVYANMPIRDMEQYNYIGKTDFFYLFENPNPLSLGIYVPDGIENLLSCTAFPANFYNELAAFYLGQDTEALFDTYYLEGSPASADTDYVFFTDMGQNSLSYEEAETLYRQEQKTNSMGPLSDLRMNLHFVPQKSGEAYLYAFEFVSLGKVEQGVPVSLEISYPNAISTLRNAYNYVILNEDVFDAFCQAVSANQLENVQIGNNSITGTTNYAESGYTMLSLAYDRNWHAYLDGQEVEISDALDSVMLIKTPAGQHTLELQYIPYGMKTGKLITFFFWAVTLAGYALQHILSKRTDRGNGNRQ